MGISTSIACVLPVRGHPALLDGCIAAIQTQDVRVPDLIVVDDSPDASLEPIEGAQTLRSWGRGPYAARNLGAQQTDADVVLFLDVRSRPRPAWARRLAEVFRDPSVALAGSQVHVLGGASLAARASERHDFFRLENYLDPPFFRPYLPTCNLAVRREDFLTVGGFRELRSGGDADLCWRVLSRPGRRLEPVPDVLMDWIPRDRVRDYLEQNYRYGKSNWALRRTWQSAGAPELVPVARIVLLRRGCGVLVRMARAAVTGGPDEVAAQLLHGGGLALAVGYRVAADAERIRGTRAGNPPKDVSEVSPAADPQS